MSYATSVIKSIQRGTITISGFDTSQTATITSINTAKSFISFGGSTSVNTSTSAEIIRPARVVLTNSTTVTATCAAQNSSAATTISYEVVEYF
jgi:hypothetical protein